MKKGTELAVVDTDKVGFSREQSALLGDKLDPAHLKTRKQGKDEFTYIEGWRVIERANAIFGFDGWDRQTVQMEKTVQETYERPGWNNGPADTMHRIGFYARVRISVHAGGRTVIREGSGYGQGTGKDPNMAFEGAIKEAETDATKRALTTMGDQFGLTLYDKSRANVSTPDYVVRAETNPISSDQVYRLRELIASTETDEEKFAAHMKVATIEELPGSRFDQARNLLLTKHRKSKGGAA